MSRPARSVEHPQGPFALRFVPQQICPRAKPDPGMAGIPLRPQNLAAALIPEAGQTMESLCRLVLRTAMMLSDFEILGRTSGDGS